MPAPAPAISQQVVWKNDEVLAFAVSLVRHALAKLNVGATHFTTDIVPDADRGSGSGIAGSVVTMLQAAHVLKPVGLEVDKIWYPLHLKSQRPSASARYVRVYQLVSCSAATEFLERNEALVPPKETQPDLSPVGDEVTSLQSNPANNL